MNVYGVLEVDARNLGGPLSIPTGVRLRVNLGDLTYLSLDDCNRIACLVWRAASVEIVGTNPAAIGELVAYLRRRADEWTEVA